MNTVKSAILAIGLGIASMSAPALTVETVIFNVKNGTKDAQVLDTSNKMLAVMKNWDGFIKRDLVNTGAGKWIDIVHWDSKANALAAQEKAMVNPVCLAFFALIDNDSIAMYHGDLVLSQEK